MLGDALVTAIQLSQRRLAIIPVGLCQCGCSLPVNLSARTDKKMGLEKGKPNRFIFGHASRLQKGENNPGWKGGRRLEHSYITVSQPDHPRANSMGRVREHIAIACKVLGKPLPPGAIVHHANGVKTENSNNNLVICSPSYHTLLHARMRAMAACGNPNYRKCFFCKTWDDPEHLVSPKRQKQLNSGQYHRVCWNQYMQRYRTRRSA